MTVVVDAANVVGSRPDGWWRDRAGATGRLLDRLALLHGARVALRVDGDPAVEEVVVERLVAVVEGAATAVADGPAVVEVVRAPADGDSAVVALVGTLGGPGAADVVVVTADRGLRARLPGVVCVGPRWLDAVG